MVTLNVENKYDGTYIAWLIDNNKNVCWAKGYIDSDGVANLWSIETRPKFRNKGYAKKMLTSLKENFQVDALFHSGGYTPEGRSFILPLITRPDSSPIRFAGKFESMDFIPKSAWEEQDALTGH